jgi:capsular polysaccharide biosynthesis protein
MEMKAYMEGIAHKWWLLVLVLVLSFVIGKSIAVNTTPQYTVSTSVLINDTLLATIAVPTDVVQIATPGTYQYKVVSPQILSIINKHYPRLGPSQLQQDILVTADSSNRLLLISVTDISSRSAADIANFLAQQFVITQTSELNRQLDYYEKKLQHEIPAVNSDITNRSLAISSLEPPLVRHAAIVPISPTVQRTIATDLYYLDQDESNLYNYQQALRAIEETRPLFAKAYMILQPASPSGAIRAASLPDWAIELIAIGVGLFATIILILIMEYFTPFVRHKGELNRIIGFSVSAEVPQEFKDEQKRLLLFPVLRKRIEALRLLCATIGAPAIRKRGYTVLLTSPRKKRRFATVLARLLSNNGQRTLLIDADFEHPDLHQQMKLDGVCDDKVTNNGLSLSFIIKASQPHLFLLPAAELDEIPHQACMRLIELLPSLQKIFDVIIIDASPLDRATTHLLSKQAAQTLLLVKKRRERLKTLKLAFATCQELQLDSHCILLT